jgi:hypothetical protein
VGYDGGDSEGGEAEIECEVFVLARDVEPGVVLPLGEPGGVGVEGLPVDLEGNH